MATDTEAEGAPPVCSLWFAWMCRSRQKFL